jgi:hypothetical protein
VLTAAEHLLLNALGVHATVERFCRLVSSIGG